MGGVKKPKIKLADWTRSELTLQAKRLNMEVTKARLLIKAGRERNLRKGFNLRKQLARTMAILAQKDV